MGPLIGNYIGTEFNYLLAILVGIAFGYILEQAGFSSSKRLAGQFYGTDFVVLRVFFTAAVTAALGIIFLDHFGILDSSIIYINPTYVWPMIIGGVIMGLGFILGGFCPGTSVSALAIGKIDALVFFAGLGLGAFIFVEAYPLFSDFFTSTYLGDLFIYDSLGMSRGAFTFMFVMIALVSFVVTFIIEQKVNKKPITIGFNLITEYKYHSMAIVGTIVIAGLVSFMPNRSDYVFAKAEKLDMEMAQEKAQRISPEELAYRILDNDHTITIIDLRSPEVYAKTGLPGSINIPYEDLLNRGWSDVLDNHEKRKLFVADDEALELRACCISMKGGYQNLYVLSGGYEAFANKILNPSPEMMATYPSTELAFIQRASVEINDLILNAKKPIVKPKEIKKVKGGC